MFPETIETERLDLEKLDRDAVDVRELYEICSSDPAIDDITRYLSWAPHPTIKATEEFLERVEREWETRENATYVVRPGEGEDGAGEIAGVTSLTVDWGQRTGTFGIWLRERFWGRGYSGERADAFMELCFDRLDLEVAVVYHHDGNEQSRRAVERYVERHGGRYEGLLRNAVSDRNGDPTDGHRYTVSRAEYRASA